MASFLHNFWFIQSIGIIGLIFVVFAWNAKTRRKVLDLQSVNVSLFIIHYILLGAWTGAIMSGVTLLRNLVFAQKNLKKWASHPGWLYVFIVLSLIALAIFWEGWISLLPAAGVVIGTYAISKDNPKDIRFYMLLTAIVWIPYTIIVHSYSGLIAHIISTIGLLTGMIRLDRKKKETELGI